MGKTRDVVPRIDVDDLASAGWGVVFGPGVGSEVHRALHDLLALRRRQVGRHDGVLYREMTYLSGESGAEFLDRNGAAPGAVDPEELPYYLLLVGDPESIPWDVQFELDMGYAVGRIAFPQAADYGRYAESVVTAEEEEPRLRRAAFFGVDHDPLTRLFDQLLMAPLTDRLRELHPDWRIDAHRGEAARRDLLGQLVGGHEAPAFLFTLSHGLWFGPDSESQRARHGALLCQDWPGRGTVPTSAHYFSAGQVEDAADLRGQITFHLACNSAGTPRLDAFPDSGDERRVLSHQAFVSRLPQRLLSHPRGGALAVIGHVERAWEICFLWKATPDQPRAQAKPDLKTFTGALGEVLRGRRVGRAMEVFGQRHAALAARLVATLEREKFGTPVADEELARLWLATRDTRGYVVLGDPAVRLRVAPR